MEVNIQSIRFDADQKLLDTIRVSLEKISRFDSGIPEAQVYLKLDADHGGYHSKVLEIKLMKPGNTIVAKAERASFEEALDEALEAALVQVRKLRDREKS